HHADDLYVAAESDLARRSTVYGRGCGVRLPDLLGSGAGHRRPAADVCDLGFGGDGPNALRDSVETALSGSGRALVAEPGARAAAPAHSRFSLRPIGGHRGRFGGQPCVLGTAV